MQSLGKHTGQLAVGEARSRAQYKYSVGCALIARSFSTYWVAFRQPKEVRGISCTTLMIPAPPSPQKYWLCQKASADQPDAQFAFEHRFKVIDINLRDVTFQTCRSSLKYIGHEVAPECSTNAFIFWSVLFSFGCPTFARAI